jgi:hypothetical protein
LLTTKVQGLFVLPLSWIPLPSQVSTQEKRPKRKRDFLQDFPQRERERVNNKKEKQKKRR